MKRKEWNKFLKTNQINSLLQIENVGSRPAPGSEESKDESHLDGLDWGKSSDKYRMDADKLAWHTDRVTEWLDGERIAPLHIDMGISTGCNLACHYCYGVPQGREGFQARGGRTIFMPLDVIKNVFSDAKQIGVRSIALVGEAENTLNPQLYPALNHAREINLDVGLATHGANFNQSHVETLLTSLAWLRINISAATPESYQKVHQRPWLNRVLAATELLVKQKNNNKYTNFNGEPTTLGFQMVLTDKNFDQILPLAELGRNMGVDYTVIKACSDTPDGRIGTPHDAYLELADVFKAAEEYSTENYKVIVRWNKLGNRGNKDYSTCHGTRFIIALSGDGTVFPCGHWFAFERDRFSMGNVNESSLSDIVKSERYWAVQEDIRSIDLRNCETNCRQHAINRHLDSIEHHPSPKVYLEQLRYDAQANVSHKNFI